MRSSRASSDEKVRVLYMVSDPSDKSRTRLGEEMKQIRRVLGGGSFGARFELDVLHGVAVETMTGALLDFRPHLIHFSGHGNERGELTFENRSQGESVSLEGLRSVIKDLHGAVDCIVFNSCSSEKQALLLKEHVPYIVAMLSAVSDSAAIRFSTGFYQALAAGRTIPAAFNNGKHQIETRDPESAMQPVLVANPILSDQLAGPWPLASSDSRGPGGSAGEALELPPDEVVMIDENAEFKGDVERVEVDSTTGSRWGAQVRQEKKHGVNKEHTSGRGVDTRVVKIPNTTPWRIGAMRSSRASSDEKVRVLCLVSDPSDKSRTRLVEEMKQIRRVLGGGSFGARFELDVLHGVEVETMTGAFLNFRPHLIHFSGHGNERGELTFENRSGKGESVSLEGLRSVIKDLRGTVDCIFFNSCFSEKQALLLKEHVPYIVTMLSAVNDSDAIRFSTGFYQALAAGRTIPAAFNNGKHQIETRDPESAMQPVLFANPILSDQLAGPWPLASSDSRGPGGSAGEAPELPPDEVVMIDENTHFRGNVERVGVDSTAESRRGARVRQEMKNVLVEGDARSWGAKRS